MLPSTDLGILGKEESAVSGMHELPWEEEIEYILQLDLGWISCIMMKGECVWSNR